MTGIKVRESDRWKHRHQPKPAPALSPADQNRIRYWIENQIVDWDGGCLHCKRPIVVGQQWLFVTNPHQETKARFHADCRPAWLAEQETRARTAMGMPIASGLRPTTKEAGHE